MKSHLAAVALAAALAQPASAITFPSLTTIYVGEVEGTLTANLAHGATITFSTHPTAAFTDNGSNLATGLVAQGVVNVEATNSAVFCTAQIVDAAGPPHNGNPLHLVRVNPHPGTVE